MNFFLHHFLSLLILLPAIGAIVMRFVPPRLQPRWIALSVMFLVLALSLLLLPAYDWREPEGGRVGVYAVRSSINQTGVVQLVQRVGPLPGIRVQYLAGVDGLSLPLVLLTTIVCPLACIAGWNRGNRDERFFILLLLLESAALGTFLSLDLVFFFLFLIAAQFLITAMLREDPAGESLVFPFSAAQSVSAVLILIVIASLRYAGGTFDMVALAASMRDQMGSGSAKILFVLLMLGLLMRIGAFPLHAYLQRAQREVPLAVNMLLPVVMQASAAYAIFRVALPLFPVAARSLAIPVAILGIVGFFHGALCGMAAKDFKRLAGFLSISQMGLILLGAAAFTSVAHHGALFMLVSHGLIISMLYVLSDIASRRADNISTAREGFTSVALLAAMGTPLTSGFVGPLLIVLGIFAAAGKDSMLLREGQVSVGAIYAIGIAGCIGLILNAIAAFRPLHAMLFARHEPGPAEQADLEQRDLAILIPLTFLIVSLGIIPNLLYFLFTRTTIDALERVLTSR